MPAGSQSAWLGSGDGRQRLCRIGDRGGVSDGRPPGPRTSSARPARGPTSIRATRSRSAICWTAPRSRRRSRACAISFTPPPTTGSGRPPPTTSCAPMSKARRIVMEEALRAGVERIVYTSSVATFDLRAGGLADETRHLPHTEAIGAYKRSKIIAEECRRRHGRPRPASGGDRQSIDADRAARRQADADRPHHHRSRVRPDAGVHRDRPELRPCRRRARRAISPRCNAAGSASAISSAARTSRSARCCSTSPASSAGGRRPLRLPRGALYPFAYGAELLARGDRPRAVRHRRWAAHGALHHAFRRRQGAARARLHVAALSRGLGRGDRVVHRRPAT